MLDPQPKAAHNGHQCLCPTMTSTEETFKQFCAELSSTLCFVPAYDKLNLLGDFNVHIGCDHR